MSAALAGASRAGGATMKAILAGGPLHGRTLDITDRLHEFIEGYQPPTPLAARPVAPRPKWWRDPLGWWRWRPGILINEGAPVAEVRLLYRRVGFLLDDTPIYWYQGEFAEVPTNADDVLRHLYDAQIVYQRDHVFDGRFASNTQTHWEMGPEWYAAVRRAAFTGAGYWQQGDMLLAYPVKVTTGAPRLADEDTPS